MEDRSFGLFSKKECKQMRMLLNALQIPSLLINRKHEILFQNNMSRRLFGAKIGGICWEEFWGGKTLPDHQKNLYRHGIITDDMRCTFCESDRALDEKKPIMKELKLANNYWESWWVPITDDIFLHYFINITKIKESEEKYRESEKFLRQIADLVPDLIWAKDVNKRFIFTNKATCKTLLNTENTDEPIGKTLDYFVRKIKQKRPSDDSYYTIDKICNQTDNKVLASKKAEQFEEAGNIKGKRVYLDVIKVPWFEENGSLKGIIGTARDITKQKLIENELKKTQEELKQSLSYHKALFKNNAAMMLVVDEKRTIIDVNPAFLKAFKYTKEELVGKNTSILHINKEYYEKFFLQYKDILDGKRETDTTEFCFKRKDNTLLWAEVKGSYIKLSEGKTGIIWSAIDTTQIHQLKEQLKHQAMHDQLTDLYNRYALEEELTRAIERAKRNNTLLAVCLIDLDNFKPINDKYGHEVGDIVLKTIAKRLKATIRKSDFLARFGGDEFVLLLENIKGQECLESIFKKIEKAVREPIYIDGQRKVNVGLSMGVCVYPKATPDNPDLLLRNSDIAMYEAKKNKDKRDRFYQMYCHLTANTSQ
ncbi:sensor domain-containing protein [Hippea sp. KM1]|uniref:sensor domain-containing protein n=1 Tax=Hippea sp. KM1 TaxID=944481 RepID=UPI00046C99B8|nr:diguanylate cyclase [Hippea sp. KM1]